MGTFIGERVVKEMTSRRIHVVDSRILVMGLTFKENCPDIRNSRVVDLVKSLKEFNAEVDIYDPWVEPAAAEEEYGLRLVDAPDPGTYDAVIVAVAHDCFRKEGLEKIRSYGRDQNVIFDVKYLFPVWENLARL